MLDTSILTLTNKEIFMIAQELLSKSGSTVKTLVGSHPIVLGIVVGLGAYYVVNKYLLNDDEEVTTAEESESKEDTAS